MKRAGGGRRVSAAAEPTHRHVAAIASGMTTLMQDGSEKVLDGSTDLKQLLAVSGRRALASWSASSWQCSRKESLIPADPGADSRPRVPGHLASAHDSLH
jgi:hypothetical protein